MMKNYQVLSSFHDDMGSFAGFTVRGFDINHARTKALWHYNSARLHDGLKRWETLPKTVIVQRSTVGNDE